ncbi:MAG TPA: riboflavin synthase [Fimbriimonadaceae bacterium]|nr:riboflavin synthase [Fimbriimonadaceae bacterium]
MFTGLVQALGRVDSLEDGRLRILAPPADYELGESVAVNGACLTVVESVAAGASLQLAFDLSEETLRRTALSRLEAGARVNLERAMTLASRLGGHIVQGHVDAVGRLLSITQTENAHVFRFACPPEFDRYLIDKGSIAIDGISLTVVNPQEGEFDTWIIPHTLEQTTLGDLHPDTPVNLEFDVLAKHVEKLLSTRAC